MASDTVKWGILGSGGIASQFLDGSIASGTGRVTALGTRARGKPDLEERFAGLEIHEGYENLLADPAIDAVYVATPHAFHAEWAIRAAQCGKHVLCEKPLAMNAAEAEAMFDAARRANVFMAEAFMYRLHPLTSAILQFLDEGRLGEVRMIKSSFGFAVPGFHPRHRLFDKELGGGAILDLGGYPMSMARLIAGHGSGAPLEPSALQGFMRNGPTEVDEIASALVAFPNGVIADLSCSLALWQDNILQILGTCGRLEVDSFWFGSGKTGGTARMRFVSNAGEMQTIEVEEQRNLYSFQFEAVNQAIMERRTRLAYPGMNEADTIGNMQALDWWLREAQRVSPDIKVNDSSKE